VSRTDKTTQTAHAAGVRKGSAVTRPIDVLLITGFLGSGKTTLLNRLIDAFPRERRLVVLMNEFGEIGIDGALIHRDREFEVLEISKGSIFCVCAKSDFIKSLSKIAGEMAPDMLIIEATGAANPTDIRKDLNLSLFRGRFRLLDQVCLLDAIHFLDTYAVFLAIEKQIASSTVFLINKTDATGANQIAAIKDVVRVHHPSPEFWEVHYAGIPVDRLLGSFSDTAGGPVLPIPEADVRLAIDALLRDPFAAKLPPDRLKSAVFRWTGTRLPDLEALVRDLPAAIVRGKGFLDTGEGVRLLSVIMGKAELKAVAPAAGAESLMNILVIIASDGDMDAIEAHPSMRLWLKPVARLSPMPAG